MLTRQQVVQNIADAVIACSKNHTVEVLDNNGVTGLRVNGVDFSDKFVVTYDHDEYLNTDTANVIMRVNSYDTTWSENVRRGLMWDEMAKTLLVAAHDHKRQLQRQAFAAEVRTAIIAACQQQGAKARLVDDRRIIVNGFDVSYVIGIDSDNRSVTIGTYGDRSRFPQRKDGTHAYNRIAGLLIAHAERQKKQAETEQARATNDKQVVQTLHESLKLSDYIGVMTIGASADTERPVFVKVEIQRPMTAENATKLHAALVELGYITQT